MFAKISLAAGVVMMAAAFAPMGASAAPAMPQSTIADLATDPGALLQKVQFRHCRYWHRECAERWGWRTRMYYRCLARHGC